jgi:hypothetical protein
VTIWDCVCPLASSTMRVFIARDPLRLTSNLSSFFLLGMSTHALVATGYYVRRIGWNCITILRHLESCTLRPQRGRSRITSDIWSAGNIARGSAQSSRSDDLIAPVYGSFVESFSICRTAPSPPGKNNKSLTQGGGSRLPRRPTRKSHPTFAIGGMGCRPNFASS